MKLKDLFKEKGILSGKKVLALTMALTFVSGMTLGAAASNHTWGSTGNVVYDNNGTKTTVFNKQDLVYLDDRISTIEAGVDAGKVNIANKLNEWELPADKIVSTTNPTFDQINAALEYIKSIPNAGKEWKDASNNSYYVKEDGSITTNASEAKKNADGNAEPLKIAAATAGNLSAGSAAWVDGSLLIGTGADNKNYYELNSGKIDQKVIDYIYYRTANHTQISSWYDIYKHYISLNPYSISATKEGDVTGNSGNGNAVSDTRSMTIQKVKKGDTVSYSVDFNNNTISADADIYMSFNGGAEQTISSNRNGTYTFTEDYDSVTVRLRAQISCWGDNIRQHGRAHISATYNGSYENFCNSN